MGRTQAAHAPAHDHYVIPFRRRRPRKMLVVPHAVADLVTLPLHLLLSGGGRRQHSGIDRAARGHRACHDELDEVPACWCHARSPSSVEGSSAAAPSSVFRLRARRWYHSTMSPIEKTRITVEMALISGVMPRLSRDQISSGNVFSRPIKKKLTAISSIESVKISRPAATSDTRRFGSVTRRKVVQWFAPRSSEASSCARSSFCSPANNSVVATDISAVPWPRVIVNRL